MKGGNKRGDRVEQRVVVTLSFSTTLRMPWVCSRFRLLYFRKRTVPGGRNARCFAQGPRASKIYDIIIICVYQVHVAIAHSFPFFNPFHPHSTPPYSARSKTRLLHDGKGSRRKTHSRPLKDNVKLHSSRITGFRLLFFCSFIRACPTKAEK